MNKIVIVAILLAPLSSFARTNAAGSGQGTGCSHQTNCTSIGKASAGMPCCFGDKAGTCAAGTGSNEGFYVCNAGGLGVY